MTAPLARDGHQFNQAGDPTSVRNSIAKAPFIKAEEIEPQSRDHV